MSIDFYTDQLHALVGATIVGVTKDPDNEFFGLALRMPNGAHKTLWILRDDEGNGPGSFDLKDV